MNDPFCKFFHAIFLDFVNVHQHLHALLCPKTTNLELTFSWPFLMKKLFSIFTRYFIFLMRHNVAIQISKNHHLSIESNKVIVSILFNALKRKCQSILFNHLMSRTTLKNTTRFLISLGSLSWISRPETGLRFPECVPIILVRTRTGKKSEFCWFSS